ncbi:MAG: hypothetical protein GY924_09235, partial [Planctomycetaceae bacterium]|nr:hypothetical protein [Planctomycetaceae bacterium]
MMTHENKPDPGTGTWFPSDYTCDSLQHMLNATERRNLATPTTTQASISPPHLSRELLASTLARPNVAPSAAATPISGLIAEMPFPALAEFIAVKDEREKNAADTDEVQEETFDDASSRFNVAAPAPSTARSSIDTIVSQQDDLTLFTDAFSTDKLKLTI